MKYQDWFNLGLTIVDSLDTLWIMNLKKGNSFNEDFMFQILQFSLVLNIFLIAYDSKLDNKYLIQLNTILLMTYNIFNINLE